MGSHVKVKVARLILLLIAIGIGLHSKLTLASSSSDEFFALSDDERLSAVIQAFERRLEHATNISYEAKIKLQILENNNGAPGKLKVESPVRICRGWCLGESYRIDSDVYEPKDDSVIANNVSSGYDSTEGIGRSTIRWSSNRPSAGRIDSVQDPIVRDDRYKYWLRGDFPHQSEFLFQYLLDHRKDFAIGKGPNGFVELTVDYQPSWATESGGKRVFLLDPQKDFLPIQGISRWDADSKGKQEWRSEKFKVKDSKLVGDVWMPTAVDEEILASSAPEIMNVYSLYISKIEHGKVTTDDLLVRFTEGMEIVDALQGVTYIADARGMPAGTVKPLYLSADLTSSGNNLDRRDSPWSFRRASVIVNVIVLLAILVALVVKKRRYIRKLWTR